MRFILLIFLLCLICWLLVPNKFPRQTNINKISYDRIITLAPSYCETIHALGQAHRLVGVTNHCKIPQAQDLPKIGSFQDANLEAILALNPDLVLAVPHVMAKNLLDRLRDLGFPVFAHQPDSLEDIYFITRKISEKLEVKSQGELIIKKIKYKIKNTKQKITQHKNFKNKNNILIAVSSSPFIVAGENTFSSQILAHLGFKNSAQNSATSWPIWPLEKLISDPPNIILICNGTENFSQYQILFSNLGIFNLKKQPVLITPDKALFISPSPRLIEDIQIFSQHVLKKLNI